MSNINLNLIVLAGRLANDPTLKPAGESKVVEFTVATNRSFKRRDGERADEAQFIPCECWGKRGESLAKHFTKGQPIVLQGRLEIDRWQDGDQYRSRAKILVESWQFAGAAPAKQAQEAERSDGDRASGFGRRPSFPATDSSTPEATMLNQQITDPINPLRYVPPGAASVTKPDILGVVYVYGDESSLAAIAYGGRRRGAAWHLSFASRDRMNASVDRFFANLAAHDLAKRNRRGAIAAYQHTLQVGDILVASWGYDQTNVDFFQIIAVPTGRTIVLRSISNATFEQTGFMSGTCIPVRDAFTGAETKKRVGLGDTVAMKHGIATKWDGRPRYWSSYA